MLLLLPCLLLLLLSCSVNSALQLTITAAAALRRLRRLAWLRPHGGWWLLLLLLLLVSTTANATRLRQARILHHTPHCCSSAALALECHTSCMRLLLGCEELLLLLWPQPAKSRLLCSRNAASLACKGGPALLAAAAVTPVTKGGAVLFGRARSSGISSGAAEAGG